MMPRRKILKGCAALYASLKFSSAASAAPAAAKDVLSRRAISSTGESLPVIGLGTWQTFDVGSEVAARAPLREVLAAFFAAGGRLLDSSPMYGRSEAVVGELLSELAVESRFVATKVWTTGREAGIRQLEQSLLRLRTPRPDLLQI